MFELIILIMTIITIIISIIFGVIIIKNKIQTFNGAIIFLIFTSLVVVLYNLTLNFFIRYYYMTLLLNLLSFFLLTLIIVLSMLIVFYLVGTISLFLRRTEELDVEKLEMPSKNWSIRWRLFTFGVYILCISYMIYQFSIELIIINITMILGLGIPLLISIIPSILCILVPEALKAFELVGELLFNVGT